MTTSGPYNGWLLDPEDRTALLVRFPPAYPDVVAHHVTLKHGPDAVEPPQIVLTAEVVGIADDAAGVQALVVAIGGDTRRPDGSRFHITWSLDRAAGRAPRESNAVIRDHGWVPVDPVAPIRLTPGRWPN